MYGKFDIRFISLYSESFVFTEAFNTNFISCLSDERHK